MYSCNRVLNHRWAARVFLGLWWTVFAAGQAEPADPPPTKAPALTAEQQARLKERDRWGKESQQLRTQNKLPEAIAAAEKMLAIEREVYGDLHEEVAGSLAWLAELHEARQGYGNARRFRQEVLAIQTKRHGEKDWRATDARLALSDLALLERSTPANRRQLAEASQANAKAVDLYQKGKYREALEPFQRALDLRKEILGERHPLYATSLNNLAMLYEAIGEYGQALSLYRQALHIRKEVLGERHPLYAQSLNNLAMLYQNMGEYGQALPLLRQALSIHKEMLGERHPHYATNLNNLAMLYHNMGEYGQALPLYRQALSIHKEILGERHPHYALSLTNLAVLYQDMGEYGQALPLCRQALHIRKEVLGERHPLYAHSLNNLAVLYQDMGEYGEALPLYRQVLSIHKEVLGERHPLYTLSLNNLALLYQDMGEYGEALPLYRQALHIRKEVLGERHPDYAQSLNDLALLYQDMGEYGQALPLFRQALSIRKEILGERHPRYALSLNALALFHASRNQPEQGEPLARQAVSTSRQLLHLTASVQSERQQLAMTKKLRKYLDSYLSVASAAKAPGEQIYAEVLAWKGAVTARQRLTHRMRRALGPQADPKVVQLYAELTQATRRLANLVRVSPAPQKLDEHRRTLEQLSEEIERLERSLAEASREFRKELEQRRRTPEDLRKILPADAVLVDLLEYSHFLPPKEGKGKGTRERRLAAFVVRNDRPVERLDLGPAEPVAQAIEAWRRDFGRGPAGAELRRLVWAPLEAHVRDARTVLLSPDGTLARFPWPALPGKEPGTYLLEERAVAIIPIPQLLPELLDATAAPPGPPSLLLVGDVNFGAQPGSSLVAADRARSAPRGGQDKGRLVWLPLPNTRGEVVTIKDSFQRSFRRAPVAELREDEATEEEVRKEALRHRYLHFATHGFFAPPSLRSALAAASRAGTSHDSDRFSERDVAGFHPGLLSGLVLAGANQEVQPGRDDGILTALEVAALDLGGVELATLSACETGLGETAGGEGLLGLQRAFQIAGTRSVVASLWQVKDDAARALMVEFYENLWKKKLSKVEALRQAQLTMLREGIKRNLVPLAEKPPDGKRLPPYYWAAFVLSGDWR